ncbi:hypothetical protein ABT167_24570 [Streptomyces sp. NPDC001792]|uniref:hypothetical protein n=1 Tax=Streptomyces sp. NPDC001792 TaxID=3154524 RepID=UPI00332B1903
MKSGPSGLTRCRLVVDGQVAVTSIIEQWESGTTLRNVAYGTYGLTSANVKKEGPKYIVSDSKTVGHVSCSKPEKADHEVFTMIRKEHGTIDTTTMEKIITEFTDAASTAKECAGPST